MLKDLSARERQILGLASAGLLDKNISTELEISPNTLRTYWHRIRQKCGNLPRGALTAAFVQGQLPFSEDTALAAPGSEQPLTNIDDPATLRHSAIYFATELRRVQEAFRRTERACNVYMAFVREHESIRTDAELAAVVSRVLVEVGGYVMAWVGIVNHDEGQTISVLSSHGDRHGYLRDIQVSWGESEHGQGPTGLAVRTGKTQVNQDFLANPRMLPWRDRAMISGFQASIGLPLARDDIVFAVLSVYAEEPDAFSEKERNVLEELVCDLAADWPESPFGAG